MKILHFSDAHIGVENYGRTDPDTGLSTRLTDFLDTLDEVADYAIEERVDLVLFCGDAYKSRNPNQTHQREFARRIARLSTAEIPVFLLVGNHDMPFTTSRASALEIFRTLDVRNVYTGDQLDIYRIPTASGPVQVLALPWVRRSAFLAREETRGMTPEQVNEAIQQALTDLIRARADELDESVPAIFAGHVSVGEAKTGSEQSMLLGRDHVLLKSSVALPQFDYVALGHIHRRQELGRNPPVVYAGSLQRVDFGEEQDDKGFYVVDIDPAAPQGKRATSFDFHQVDARRFLTIPVDISRDDPNPTATVIEAITNMYFDGTVVRVMIRIPADLASHLRDADIRGALDGAHFVAAISRELVAESRSRLGGADTQTLDPVEALKLYWDSRSMPTDRAKLLLRRAAELMEDEETA